MVPKDTPKTAPCSLAQPKKILRDFMVSGEVSEPDTCRITISRLIIILKVSLGHLTKAPEREVCLTDNLLLGDNQGNLSSKYFVFTHSMLNIMLSHVGNSKK